MDNQTQIKKLIDILKEKNILKYDIINKCNRDIVFHTDCAFQHYINNNLEDASAELDLAKKYLEDVQKNIKKLSK